MADKPHIVLDQWLKEKRPAYERSISMITDPKMKAWLETEMAAIIEKIKRAEEQDPLEGGLKGIKPHVASINYEGIKELLVITAEKVNINGVVHERSGGWTLGQLIERAVDQQWWAAGKDVKVDNVTTNFSPVHNIHWCIVGFGC